MGRNEEKSWRDGLDSKLARLEEGQRRLEGWQERADEKFQRLEEWQERADGRFQRLEEWQERADEKFQRLEEWQDRADGRFQRLEEWQDRADGRFQRLDEGLMRNNDILGIVIERIDHIEAERQRSEAEQRRYFEILIEQTRWDRSAQGEGIKANRERLDDHEARITNLEAS